ncbi:hypothetical protein [Streptomyces sp. NBC_01304]|uniref:hypothetical protein n=1 Tax=Streptomyces sp. NBC_01304 TaxID=2903818 RepID=UPI002E12DFBF|nr:hypothetical protein OG430_03705 [Streptomyces sp. NBC_01304]
MSQDQPEPYYGQQQPPPPPEMPPTQGYGYPQQAPAGYGPPPPQAPPLPYGAVPPQPAGGSPSSKRTGAIVGAVLVLAAIGGGVWYLTSDDGSGLADDGPHKLTAPVSLLDGDFKRSGNDGEPDPVEDSGSSNLFSGVLSPGAQVINPDYTSSSKDLIFVGAYGESKDPAKSLDTFFGNVKKEVADEDDVELIGAPENVSPANLDGALMKCQKAKGALSGDEELNYICAWADYSTVALVIANKESGTYSLEEAARIAADVRKETRAEGQ